ncbi:hypothetical protein llg_43640 [Luteolibacter sp. LG18]|nr:hypothetical protein llg_07220 [Luteolibacter sp. LG18]BCU79649.1 hypothetical protein llg_43640 [Luteolibacter sp. LG18]
MTGARNQKPKATETRRRAVDVELARKGWTQSDLAKAIGRARNTVNRAINHGENPKTLNLILSELGIR